METVGLWFPREGGAPVLALIAGDLNPLSHTDPTKADTDAARLDRVRA